jgi:hypothetical protein
VEGEEAMPAKGRRSKVICTCRADIPRAPRALREPTRMGGIKEPRVCGGPETCGTADEGTEDEGAGAAQACCHYGFAARV